jgi:hypothetical protein
MKRVQVGKNQVRLNREIQAESVKKFIHLSGNFIRRQHSSNQFSGGKDDAD